MLVLFLCLFLSNAYKVLNMSEKFSPKEKFQKVFYPLLYLLSVVVFVLSGTYIFNTLYYTKIYVNGDSMAPTLIGNASQRVHYGICDNHDSALQSLKRFDVVITLYPDSWTADKETYKIKRVWAFPGETISLDEYKNPETKKTQYKFTATKDNTTTYQIIGTAVKKEFNTYGEIITVKFTTPNKTFYTKIGSSSEITTHREFENLSLDKNNKEYFLMGDNWTDSSDSYSNLDKGERITYKNLKGRVVAIQGTAKLVDKTLVDIDTKDAKTIF